MYAWRHRVEKLYLNPPDGVCFNVLNTAVRHGDGHLAADVIRILGNRGAHLELQHHEALADAYVAGSDVKTALAVHCMTEDAGFQLLEASMSLMFQRLGQDPVMLEQAVVALSELRREGHSIPTASVNCVIHASVQQGRVRQGIQVYKSLHELCPAGPNTATFNILLQACVGVRQRELGRFLFAEMSESKVQANALTYDNMIRLCLTEDDRDDAFGYLEDLKRRRLRPRASTSLLLLRNCVEGRDRRAWDLLTEMEAAGVATTGLRTWLGRTWHNMSNKEMDRGYV